MWNYSFYYFSWQVAGYTPLGCFANRSIKVKVRSACSGLSVGFRVWRSRAGRVRVLIGQQPAHTGLRCGGRPVCRQPAGYQLIPLYKEHLAAFDYSAKWHSWHFSRDKDSSIFWRWVKCVILLRCSYSTRAGVGGGLFPKDKMFENGYCCCYIGTRQDNLAKKK